MDGEIDGSGLAGELAGELAAGEGGGVRCGEGETSAIGGDGPGPNSVTVEATTNDAAVSMTAQAATRTET